MKFGLYPRLALAGIRKNKRLYVPYLLTCTGMVMMYYKVGWEAVRLGIVAFLIPYSFCLTPGVIMLDFSSFATGVTGVLSALLTLLAALPIAWLMQGYTYRRVGILWRLLFAVCAVMLIIPDLIIEIPAAVIVLGIYYLHKRDYVKGRSIPA